ncbi:MAG: 6-carboxytetrahydropterin synthase [Bacteroidales bacterium]|nr:6-carboxytetrahydropterin synthase [Bacteroidales bacterium]MBQ1882057.1 6-carboxytetrahydropterin synthase [Bacteroidales bacterium]MBQ4198072.1 6-carboxytetrahydropterin synthase [Bacteroidales bacterium]
MSIIRITREFSFEGAHALGGYDGKCCHIHGHSYRMAVTVSGNPIEDDNSPKKGMVLDFTDLKKIVNENIIDKFDHALVMKEGALLAEDIGRVYGNVVTVDFQPTSEMLVIHFADIVKSLLPEGIQLHSIKLWETEKSCAEWYAEDNR